MSYQQQQDIRSIKRAMTLDLAPASGEACGIGGAVSAVSGVTPRSSKRLRGQLATPVLSSPDLNRFVLASPEVEKFIKNSLTVSSSTQPTPVSAYIFPSKNPTSQQTQFVKGFEEALEQCKLRESAKPSAASATAASLPPTTISEEPRSVQQQSLLLPPIVSAMSATSVVASGVDASSSLLTSVTGIQAVTPASVEVVPMAPASTVTGPLSPGSLDASTVSSVPTCAADLAHASSTAVASTTTLTTLTPANLHALNAQLGSAMMGSSQSSSALSSVDTHSNSDTSDSMSMMAPVAAVSGSSCVASASDLGASTAVTATTFVKDEQTVPVGVTSASPSALDPIDMRDQEKLKLERKRLRNRIAASKCRKKKLERISQLEDQVNKLKNDNHAYQNTIAVLRREVDALRQEALLHQQRGCHIEI